MSPTLTSQGLVLATATAMAVSAGTVVLFDLLREKYFHQIPRINHQLKQPPLKSCLITAGEGKKNEKEAKKKKVRFAEDVKETKGNGQVYRKQGRKKSNEIQKNSSCGNEILECQKMPANHVALYSGILKNRVQRLGCSY